jgi:hypothetical protein
MISLSYDALFSTVANSVVPKFPYLSLIHFKLFQFGVNLPFMFHITIIFPLQNLQSEIHRISRSSLSRISRVLISIWRPIILTDIFRCFPQPFLENNLIIPKLCWDLILIHPFKLFFFHKSSYQATLHN